MDSKNSESWIDETLIFPGLKAYINTLAKGMSLPPAIIIQNMLIRRIAEEDAEATVYNDGERLLPEFYSEGGELVTGQELYDLMFNEKRNELEKEYINNLAAVPVEALTDHDREILGRHGKLPEQRQAQEKQAESVEELRKKYNIPQRKPGQNSHWEE